MMHDLGDLADDDDAALAEAVGDVAGEAGEDQERGREDELCLALAIFAGLAGDLRRRSASPAAGSAA